VGSRLELGDELVELTVAAAQAALKGTSEALGAAGERHPCPPTVALGSGGDLEPERLLQLERLGDAFDERMRRSCRGLAGEGESVEDTLVALMTDADDDLDR